MRKNDLEGQIRLDQMYRERRFTRKSCAATLDDCPHIPGMCVEECCQTCDIPCGSRCGYSVKQPKVKVEEKWVINPDFEGSNSEQKKIALSAWKDRQIQEKARNA